MPKDDPLQQQNKRAKTTLWLDRENNAEARANFLHAFEKRVRDQSGIPLTGADRNTWSIAWAAAIAAIDFVFQGKVEP